MPRRSNQEDPLPERDETLKTDNQAQLDELGEDPGEVGLDSAGQSGDAQELTEFPDADEESVGELHETGQDYESVAVDGVEDAADHPERPAHTHEEYGNPDDVPPQRRPGTSDIDVPRRRKTG